MRILIIAMLAGASLSGASSSVSVKREGSGWSATIRGELPAANRSLTILSPGGVSVRGARQEGAYALTVPIDVQSEADARRVASQVADSLASQMGSSVLRLPCAPRPIQIEIPRSTRQLILAVSQGDIRVADLRGGVLAHADAGDVSVDRIGGSVEIESQGGEANIGLVEGSVRCRLRGGMIRARTIRGAASFDLAGGDMDINEVLGAVDAFTGAGSIRIGHAGGSVNAVTQGGSIVVGRAAGTVVARNAGGPIRVGPAKEVDCATGSGSIEADAAPGGLTAVTGFGGISVVFSRNVPAGKTTLSTGGGDITVGIPSNANVRLRVSNCGGSRVESDFPLHRVGWCPVAVSEGVINAGGPVLQMAAQGGTISIRRLK